MRVHWQDCQGLHLTVAEYYAPQVPAIDAPLSFEQIKHLVLPEELLSGSDVALEAQVPQLLVHFSVRLRRPPGLRNVAEYSIGE